MTMQKQKIYACCMEKANEQNRSLKKIPADLKESGCNETKSTGSEGLRT